MDHGLDLPLAPQADEVADDYVGPHRQAHKQVGQQVDGRGVAPHRPQSLPPGKMAYHGDIGRVEQLL